MYQPQSLSQSQQADDAQKSAQSVSLIDQHSHFDGLYVTSHDLRIEGNAEGEIQCEGTVTIVDAANVEAQIRARNVVLAGAAKGEILCQERFTLRPTGKMRGRVRAASLVIEEGAFFEGEFQMGIEGDQSGDFATWFAQEESAPSSTDQSDAPTLALPDAPAPTAGDEDDDDEYDDEEYDDDEEEEYDDEDDEESEEDEDSEVI